MPWVKSDMANEVGTPNKWYVTRKADGWMPPEVKRGNFFFT